MSNEYLTTEYAEFLESLKKRVTSSRFRAACFVNQELIMIYHQMGMDILNRQEALGWGSKVIDKLSRDLSSAFPEMKGFSTRNLKYMKRLAETYPDVEFVQQVVAQLPWGHSVHLLDRVLDPQRLFYIHKSIECGWSRSMLLQQIELKLFHRQGKAVNNFKTKLSLAQSELANQTFKDPYVFDFLSLGTEAHEREVEKALMQHMGKFLIELGAGFSFVGRQYPLDIAGEDFYIDMLFYHLKLRSFVVVELKSGKFKPEYSGKMNFYLSAIDDLVKHPSDNPSIGLILCKSKNNVLAEYALRDMSKSIGLAEYRLSEALPDNLKIALPTIRELEAELLKDIEDTKDENVVCITSQ